MLIGLTGGVATGKTVVSKELAALGAYIIDADIIARSVLKRGGAAFDGVVLEFGEEIVQSDGEVDRKRLGAIVFSDREQRERLNALTHPMIVAEMEELARTSLAQDPGRLVVFDAPLLIEVGLHKRVDKTVVVTSSAAAQIERIRERDTLNVEEAEQRVDSQIPVEKKAEYADIVIVNTGSVGELREKARDLYRELTGD